MSTTQSTGRGRMVASMSFMSLAFLSGIGAALFVPTMSLFLTSEVGVSPFMVGVFFTINAVCGIAVSQLLARRSDQQGSRRRLIFICMLAGMAACLCFALTRNYWALISLGVLMLSISATSSPQLFALAREFADGTGRQSVMFTSWMRAMFSLSWVIGPPLAFAVCIHFGFTALFLCGLAIYGLSTIVVRWMLPEVARLPAATAQSKQGTPYTPAIRWLFAASMLFWTCNSMYLINMPLYITHELGLPQALAGWMMGTAAGLEIPIMLCAAQVSKRTGKWPLLMVSGAAAILFYIGMSLFHNEVALLVLQLGNAMFIGILAGLGMLYFQDMMPGRPGEATTLFTNSVRSGSIIAGGIAGMVAQWWSYYGVFLVAIGLVVMAVGMLWQAGRLQRR